MRVVLGLMFAIVFFGAIAMLQCCGGTATVPAADARDDLEVLDAGDAAHDVLEDLDVVDAAHTCPACDDADLPCICVDASDR